MVINSDCLSLLVLLFQTNGTRQTMLDATLRGCDISYLCFQEKYAIPLQKLHIPGPPQFPLLLYIFVS